MFALVAPWSDRRFAGTVVGSKNPGSAVGSEAMAGPLPPAPKPPPAPGAKPLPALEPSPRGGSPSPPPPSTTRAALPRVCPSCLGRYPADFRVCPRDATPLEDAPEDADPMLGVVLADAFQIVRCIGEGGMARVYEARHVRLANKRFAVKVLLPAHAQSPEIVARFQREAEAASGIGHPNVIDVYDVHHTDDGLPYIVCEYLDGTDLATLIDDRGSIDVLLAVGIVRQVCRALAAAHARGIVHRDVKPENVFLVGDPDLPVVKVIDFGISKVDQTGGATLTRTGMIMGTPGYMPPEQARGARADHRADIYGVGAMLYHALTGRLPFDYEDPGEALSAVLTMDPPRPRSIDPSIPPALELIIQRAMAKDPDDRFATMEELDDELEPFGAEARASSMLPPHPLLPDGVTALPETPSGDPARPGSPTVVSAVAIPRARAAPKPNAALERVTREAQWARPTIALLTSGVYLWALALVVDALASLVRAGKEAPMSSTETLLVVLGVTALSITPLVFWVRHVHRAVWGNSVRSVEAAAMLRRVATNGVVAYGVGALLLRLLDSTFVPEIEPTAPLYSPLFCLISLGAAALAYLLPKYIVRRASRS